MLGTRRTSRDWIGLLAALPSDNGSFQKQETDPYIPVFLNHTKLSVQGESGELILP